MHEVRKGRVLFVVCVLYHIPYHLYLYSFLVKLIMNTYSHQMVYCCLCCAIGLRVLRHELTSDLCNKMYETNHLQAPLCENFDCIYHLAPAACAARLILARFGGTL